MELNFLIFWTGTKKDHLRIKFFWRNMLCFDIKRLNAWLASLTTVLTACEGFKRPPSFFKSRKFDDIGSLWFKKFRQSPHFSFDFICFQLCMLEYHLSIRLNCSRFYLNTNLSTLNQVCIHSWSDLIFVPMN